MPCRRGGLDFPPQEARFYRAGLTLRVAGSPRRAARAVVRRPELDQHGPIGRRLSVTEDKTPPPRQTPAAQDRTSGTGDGSTLSLIEGDARPAWLDGSTPTLEVTLSSEDASTPASAVVDDSGAGRKRQVHPDHRESDPGNDAHGDYVSERSSLERVAQSVQHALALARVPEQRIAQGWLDSNLRGWLHQRFKWFENREQSRNARVARERSGRGARGPRRRLKHFARNNVLVCLAATFAAFYAVHDRLGDVAGGAVGLFEGGGRTIRVAPPPDSGNAEDEGGAPVLLASDEALQTKRAAAENAYRHCVVQAAVRPLLLASLENGGFRDAQAQLVAHEVTRFQDRFRALGVMEQLQGARVKRDMLGQVLAPMLAPAEQQLLGVAVRRQQREQDLAALEATLHTLSDPGRLGDVERIAETIRLRQKIAGVRGDLDSGPATGDIENLARQLEVVRAAISSREWQVREPPPGSGDASWLRGIAAMDTAAFEELLDKVVRSDLPQALAGMENSSPTMVNYRLHDTLSLLKNIEAMFAALDAGPRRAMDQLDREQSFTNARINDLYQGGEPRRWVDYGECLETSARG